MLLRPQSSYLNSTYIQYMNILQINFDLTFAETNSTYCTTLPPLFIYDQTYYESNFSDISQGLLNNLQIYFLPTSEYIGNKFKFIKVI